MNYKLKIRDLIVPYLKHPGLIFIAIPKSGSTSMNAALRSLQSPDNPLKFCRTRPPTLEEIAAGDPKFRTKHLSATGMEELLGKQEFDRCLKFSMVRNSWSRTVSRYYFTHAEFEPSSKQKLSRGLTRKFHDLSFDQWMERKWRTYKQQKSNQAKQWSMITDSDGKLLVDYVDTLKNSQVLLDRVTTHLDLPKVKMPHVNGARKGHYNRLYNETTRNMVAEMHAGDIDYFNFSFKELD